MNSSGSIVGGIIGVEIKPLVTHQDSRGFFREVIRHTDSVFSDTQVEPLSNPTPFAQCSPFAQRSPFAQCSPFAQWSHSKMAKNTVKAWHYHHKQIDWWYLGMGTIRMAMYDNRPESPTYRETIEIILGEDHPDAISAVVKIPTGVLHGAKVISDMAHLFYITSGVYDTKDEGRIPYNAPEVGYDWVEGDDIIVAANDQKYFSPEYERVILR